MALGLVYLAVAPSLESRLVDSRLNDLERIAPALAREIADFPNDPDFFESASTTANARVVLLRPLSRVPLELSVAGDSCGGCSSEEVREDPLATRTSRDLAPRRSTVSRNGERFAEVAHPVGRDGRVLLLAASLDRALGDVSVVKRRLLIAGGLALAFALVVGYAGSWVFARRLRRLERAAERIADGMFDEPVIDAGNDEVGELARAFERMRRRLAQLDHARREFIANASHELRTPVFSLGGFLELLDSEELDEETRREFLTTMREQVQRLEKLATELLDLSRLDAGHIDLDRAVVPLDEVARRRQRRSSPPSRSRAGTTSRWTRRCPSWRSRTSSARCRSPGSCSRTRSSTRPRGRMSASTVPRRVGARGSPSRTTVPASTEAEAANVFERFYRVDGAQAPGVASGSRSPASWCGSWAARSSSSARMAEPRSW